MEKVLITGANGFLGKLIFKSLSDKNTVFSLSRTSGDYKVSLEKEVPLFNHKFDLVIHAAGKAHSVPKTDGEKIQFHEVNVIGTENLLKGLEKTTLPKQFVFVSSVAVYGQEFGKAINEEHQLEATDAYGFSKIEAEKIVTEWCDKQNVICTILRLPLLVGKNPPGNLGAMIKAINNGYYFNIANGKAKKSMVLATDVAKILHKASEIGGVYNLTDGYHPSFHEFSNTISKQYRKSRIINLPFIIAKSISLVGDVIGNSFPLDSNKLRKINSELTFDDSKARKILGWNPSKVVDYYKI